MARAIDKDKLITSMAWHDQQGMILSIDDILDIIEAFPALTQPNEPLTCNGCLWAEVGAVEKCASCRRDKHDNYYRRPAEGEEDEA